MKIKNSQIILVSIIFLGIYILLAGYLSILKPTDATKIEKENSVVPKTALQTVPQIVPKALSDETNQTGSKALSEEVKGIFISLQVLDKNYEIKIDDGGNVFEAMKKLQDEKEKGFSFNYKEYAGLGYFVDEINGIKGSAGKYWIYYINGKQASTGILQYVVKNGDIIEWKQE